jgi:hydrogen peroxide-dependent heme synthase
MPMAENEAAEVPQTLEGWYVLHDVWSVDWPRWHSLPHHERAAAAEEAERWLAQATGDGRGDSALYSVVSQKGDLMFVHYRESPEALNAVELALRRLALFAHLRPSYSYLSVIEVSLYEVAAIAAKRLADRGLQRGTADYDAAYAAEMSRQGEHMKSRLYREIPPQRYICFYPMSKRRGEHVNWYTLPLSERRAMMRSHGTIGHKYHETVTQVIAGSVGLDDWEWGVSLHAEDPLVFKKLVYEMRFDPASALYAEFGPFFVGIRHRPDALPALLDGALD